MLNKRTIRRAVSILLVVAGATLIFLATEAWAGVALMVLGISIEAVSIAIKHK